MRRSSPLLAIAALALSVVSARAQVPAQQQAAAQALAGQFDALGLAPAGEHGYLKPLKLKAQTIDAARSSVELGGPDGGRALTLGRDLVLGSELPQPKKAGAGLVFIGYGLSVPELGHDDFAGLNLNGKILVAIEGAPNRLPAAAAASARAIETWRAAERAGAVGLIVIPSAEVFAERAAHAAEAGLYPADKRLQETAAPRFTAAFNPAEAEALFANSGHSYAEVAALAAEGRPIAGFRLNLSLVAKVESHTEAAEATGVMALLPGTDAALNGQYVVVSGRLGDEAVLDAARRLKANGGPRRSILFAALATGGPASAVTPALALGQAQTSIAMKIDLAAKDGAVADIVEAADRPPAAPRRASEPPPWQLQMPLGRRGQQRPQAG